MTAGPRLHRNKLSLTLLLLSLALSIVAAAEIARPVSAVTNNSHVIASTSDRYVYESSYQNHGFYAQGRYWIFYEDSLQNCEGMAGCLFYKSSIDGAFWPSAAAQVMIPGNVGIHVTDSDWSIISDGNSVFYARYNETAFDTNCNRALLYGRGSIGSNGAISWLSEQVVKSPSPTSTFPNEVISIDTGNQVWIGYQEDPRIACGGSGHQTPHVIHANNSPLPSAPLSSGFTFSPANATAVFPETFTANATGGSKSYSFGWNFGDGSPPTKGQTISHTYASPGSFTVILQTNDTSVPLQSVVSTQKILVGPTLPPTTQKNLLFLQVPVSRSIVSGNPLTFTVNASDADGERVNNSSSVPPGATFNNVTGLFTWTPTTYQANQLWTISFNATDTGLPTLFVTKQVLVYVSPLWTGDVSLPASPGSQAIFDNWHVDIAILPGGQVYAAYWANKYYLLGRLYDGSSWGPEENISLFSDSTDVNSFVFATGSNVYAVWFDTNSGTLNAGLRPPGKTWQQYTIGRGEAKSVLGITGNVCNPSPCHRYSLPFTAAVNQAATPNPQFYVFWYNQTNKVIDQWSGTPGGAWLETPAAFSTQSSLQPELTIGSFHYSAPDNAGKNTFGIMWMDGASPFNLNFGLETVGSIPSFSQDASWNPKVQCTPRVVTIEQILGNQSNSLGGAAESGSIFNPGITAPSPGDAKRWLSPPCTITNADGQVVSSFVEVVGAERTQLFNEDYAVRYDPVNGGLPYPNGMNLSDTTFNIFTPGYGICNAGNTTGCMHTIHLEFDHDWKAAGYCGPNTTCDPHQLAINTAQFKSFIDFQGFVSWDPDHASEQGHSFSGWELHALTAWRISCLGGQFCSPSFSLNATPSSLTLLPGKSMISNITINAFNLFSGPVPLDAAVSPASSSAPTATLNPSIAHVQPCNSCTEPGAALNITAMPGSSGTYIVTVTGHNGTTTTRSATLTVLVQGFTLSANPQTLTIPAGTSANSTITVTSVGSFSGTVSLNATANGCACGFLTNFTPKTVTPGVGGKQNATITITAGTQTGNAVITVTGTSGVLSASTTITVAGVDYSLTVSPTSSTVLTNRLANSTITVAAINGFIGTVSLTDLVPTGLTCSLNPTIVVLSSTTASGTSSLRCSGQVGNYTVTINGSSNNISHSGTFNVRIQDFTISASPTALMVNVGSSGASKIRVAALNGFTGTVGLSQNGGTPCSLNALSVTLTSTATSANVSLTCAYTASGNNNVLVVSTSGPLVHNSTITFQVVDFTIAASPTNLTVNARSLGNSTVTLTALNGFNRTVTLSISAPSGLTCSLSLNKVVLATSPATSILSCRSSTASDYTVTVTGTNGTLSHTTSSILFHIVDFSITSLPSSSITLVVGQSNSSISIHLGSLNGFTGTVALNVLISPTGPSASLSPPSLKLTPSGCSCNASSLNINAGQGAGVYTLNVTATNGLLTRWTIITLTVLRDNPSITTTLSSSSIVAGGSDTDSAKLTGATTTAGGTVTYFLFANGVCTASPAIVSTVGVSNGVIPNSRPVVFNATGSYSFNATYSGDSNNSPASSPCEPLAVQKDSPTIITSLSPSSIQVGQSVTDSATLSSSYLAGGTVNYNLFVGSSSCAGTSSKVSTVTVTNGAIPNSRSVTFNSTNPGGYGFQAVYSGDANNNGVTSGCEPLTVSPVGVTITTGLSATTITVGGTVSDTSTLQGKTSTAGGTVTYNYFGNGNCAAPGTVISVVTVNSGVVPNSRTVTFNSSGTFSFDAAYSGDANNNGATSGCEALTVNKASPTITTIINPSATIAIGGSVTDQATVAGGFPSTGVTGTVTYTLYSFSVLPPTSSACSGGTIVGTSQTVSVGAGSSVPASSAVTPPSPGFYGFSAVYSGNGNNTAATGNCEPLTVNKQSPTITTTINPSSSIVVGTSVTDQAAIAGGFPSTGVSGSVTYRFFGVSNGVCSGTPASVQTVNVGPGNSVPPSNPQTPTSPGQYSFNATYSGDANNNQITSVCELLTVNTISTTTTIVCGSSVTIGVPTTCTVTVSDVAPGTITPTGIVNLSTNSTGTFAPPSPCNLTSASGSASCTFSYTPGVLGAHNITTTYTGDNVHKGSSGSAILSPGKHSTSISVSCSTPILVGQASTCTATVTDTSTFGATTPSGPVSFGETGVTGSFNATSCSLAGTGSTATCGVKFTPAASGTASIVGSYGGDSTHAASSNSGSPASVTINPQLIVSSPSASPSAIDAGQSASLSGSFTGGSSPYICKWLEKAPGASGFTTLGSSSSCTSPVLTSTGTLTTTGSWAFELQVNDSSSSPVAVTSGPATVIVNAALSLPTISVSPNAIDLGQSSSLATPTSFSGGTSPYACQWLVKTPGAATYSNLGVSFPCNAGDKPTVSTGALSTAGSWSFELKVTDNGSPPETVTSTATSVTVNSALTTPVISANPTTINSGQTIGLSTTTSFSGGTPTYTCQWLQKAPGASTYSNLGASLACSPGDKPTTTTGALSATGIWSFELQVNDSGSPSELAISSAVTVTVNGVLSAGSISPSAPAIDAGQAITLTSNPSGGTAPYSYQWYSDGACTTAIASVTTSTLNASPTLTSTYSVKVTDSSSSSQCSNGDTVTVNPALAAGTVTPTTPTIDSGQSITLGANSSGGTAPYHYQWYLGTSTSCSADTTLLGTAGTQSVSPTANTYYCYTVTDSSFTPASQSSATDLVTVQPTLVTGSITPASPAVDSGQSVNLTANPSGGTPPYSYQWYSAASCPSGSVISGATFFTYAASPTSTTTYSYRVADSSQGSPSPSLCSPGDSVTVNPVLAAGAITPASPTIDSGQSITLTSHATGGTPSLSYQWYSDAACTTSISGATLSTYTTSPTSSSTYSYKVTDSASSPMSQCSSGDAVTVNPALVAGAITPPSPAINSGQSITLTANPTGGTTQYNYQWYSDGTCSSLIASATSATYTPSPTVTTTYSYKVTDAASSPVSKCSPAATVTVNSAVVAGAITPANPTIDSGQSITLTSHESGGTPPFSYQWYSDGTCGTLIPGGTSSTFTASPSVTTSYSYKVTDSSQSPASGCSPAETVTVNPALNAGPVTPSAPTIDAGQSVTLTSHASGGTPSISYRWFSDGTCSLAISGATSSTYVTAPSVTTTYSYLVTDSAFQPVSQCSPADTVNVNSALVAGSIIPSSPTIDAGQSITLNANPSGGTTPYAYQWYSAASCPSGSLITGATLSTFAASPTSTTTYSYKATDSSQGSPSALQCSPGDLLTVNPVLVAGSITPSSPAVDNGQSITLTSHATGGTLPLSYQWYSDGSCTTSIPGATSSTYSQNPSSTTTYSYKVTDSANSPASQCSGGDAVTVNPALVAGPITPASPAINGGQSITLTANPSGGTTPYSYQWYSDGACNTPITLANSSTYTASPTVTAVYSYKVTDTALSPVSHCSSGDTVTVNSAIVAGAITPSNPNIDSGQSLVLTAHASGGTSPFSYQWYSGGTCATPIPGATSSTFATSPTAAATYSYQVTDSAQTPASACSPGDAVTVNPALMAGAITPGAPTINAGQSITLASHASGGTPSISYRWYSDGTCSLPITGATSPTYVTAPSVTTTFAYSATDSAFQPVTQCSPAVTVTVNPALVAGAIAPSAPTIDTGQSITLNANPSGGTTPYTYQWYSAASCASGSVIAGASLSTYATLPTTTTTYSYKVTDSSQGAPGNSQCSAGDLVTVNPALTAGAITPASPTIDSGQTITLASHASGGTPSLSYQWYSDGSCATVILGATSSTYSASPTSTSTYSYKVTDAANSPTSLCSPGDTVTVNSALVAGAITPAGPSINTGQSVTLVANPSGGTTPYGYQWYSDGTCNSLIASATSSTYSASPSVTTTYSYKVTDGAFSAVSRCSPGNTVTVNSIIVAGAITPANPTIDTGQSITLTSHESGGTPPFSYQWYSDGTCGAAIAGANSSTFTSSPIITTSYSYKVTDSAQSPASACSSPETITVNPALNAGPVTPSAPTIDAGQSITLTSHASGGTPSISYRWFSDGTCSLAISGATSSTYVAAPSVTTTFAYSVTDSAYSPVSQCSTASSVTVNSALVASAITPSAPTIDTGQSIMLNANPTGGSTPYGYQWYSAANCPSGTLITGATSSTYSASPTSTTTYSYKATDSSQGSPVASPCSPGDTVTVSGVLSAGAISPSAPTIDSGQSIALNANPSSGSAPYSYQWYSDGTCNTAIPSATSTSYSPSPTTTATYSYKVTDFSSASQCSPSDTVTVNPTLAAGPITPTSPTIDNGQSISLSAAPSAGTAPYSYQWFAAASCAGGTQVSGATLSTLVASPSLTTTYSYKVTDSSIGNPAASTCSAGDQVTVSPPLAAGPITPSGPTIDNGQSILLASAASGGTTTYSYQWFTGGTCGTAIASATSSTYNASPTSSTTYTYKVTDSAFSPVSRCSSANTVTLNSALVAGGITPASPKITSGQSLTLIANPSGGTAPYAFQWYSGVNTSCSSDTTQLGTAATQLVSPSSNTYYCYSVTDSAFTHATQSSATDLVTVNPVLTAGPITPPSPAIDIGQSIILVANPSGGTAPYSYQWYSGTSADCAADTAPLGTSPTQAVSSTSSAFYCYRVADSSPGNPPASANSSTNLVTVNPALAISSFTTTSPINSGQSTSVTVSWSGGTSPYTLTLYTSASSSSCTGLIQAGQNTGLTATSASFTQLPTTTTSYCASVTDAASSPVTIQTASSSTVVVNPALIVNTPTSSSSAVDSGQQSTLSGTFTGGTSPYACQWLQKTPGATAYSNLGNPSACSSPTSSTTGMLSTVGSWSFELQVTDSGSPSVIITSNPVTITVNSALTPPVIAVSPTTIGAGQHSTLSTITSFTGGTPAYNCQWLKKGPLDGSFSIYGSSFACVVGDKPTVSTGTLSTSGIWSFELQVSDRGSPSQVVISNAASVSVNGPLSAGAIAPSTPALDSGQSITLSANAFGGVQPYSYQWYSDGTCASAISSATLATYVASPPATATYSYNVTDSTGAHQCSPGDTVTINSVLVAGAVTPSTPTIDNGQSITLTAKPSGGTTPYSYQWYTDAGCTAAITGAASSTLLVSPGLTTTYAYKLSDSSQGTQASLQCSTGDTVTVSPSLAADAITPSSPTIDNGQSVTLTSHVSGGTAPISYQWYSDGTCGTSVTGATLPTYSASPTSTTTYSYKAVDSAFSPASQCSFGNTVTVSPALVAGAATPSTPFIDTGQSITLTAHVSGGTGPYTYQWHSGPSSTCASDAALLGTSVTQTVSPTTNTYYCYTVTDQSASIQTSQTDLVSVSPALIAGAITPPSPAIDNGQTITLTANPSGGTAPYHYQWYSSTNTVCPSGLPLGSATTLSGSPTVSTYYCYTVTDSSNGNTAVSVTSAAFLVTVNPTLTAGSITPSSPSIDTSQSIILTSNPSGGTTPYQYQWYSGPSPTCSFDTTQLGTASAQLVSPTSPTYYCYRVTDSSIGAPTASATSVTDLVTVSPMLVAGPMVPSSPIIDSGQSIALTAKPSGGVSPYSYQWYSDGACTVSIPSATSPTYSASPSSSTAYTYKVTDSATSPAAVCSNSNSVMVNPVLTAGPISPANPTFDSGQSITLTSHASGGTPSLSYQWYSDGACGASILGATLSTYTTSASANGIYTYKVTDSAFSPASQCSVGDTVTIVSGLVAGVITPAAPKIDSGQGITLTANPSGGAPPYSYQWYSDGVCTNAIPSATSSTYAAAPTATATYSYRVADSANSPASQCSAGNIITVSAALVGGVPSPSSPTIDAGQSIVLTSHASGGTSPLSYQWYSDTSCMTLIPAATSSTYTASPPSTASYSYRVTDSAYAPSSACSLGDSISVNSLLGAVAATPSSPAIDSGQPITLTAHATGGTSPFSYQWYSDGVCAAAIPGATSSTYSVSLLSTTTVSYKVSDLSQGSPAGSSCSPPDTVIVNPALVANPITPSGQQINNGQSITLTSAASGGTTPYSYQWYSAASCPSGSLISGATSSALVDSPSATTTYYYKVTDSAFSPASQCSSGDTVKVSPTLAARSITPSNPIIDIGQFILLTSQASGGTAPLSYQWYSNSGCTAAIAGATQQTYFASPTTTSSYSYRVTDSANPPVSECSPADTVTVNAGLTAGPASPNSPAIDSGQSITLVANPSGGTTPYHYQWYSGVSASCSSDTTLLGTTATQLVSPTTNTYYCYGVTDSSVGTPASTSTAISVTDLVSISPALSVTTPTSAPSAIDSGQSSNLSASFNGGVAAYTCQWLEKFPGASSYSRLGSSSSCTSSVSISTGTLATVGVWAFELQVNDSSSSPSTVISNSVAVSVNGALSSPTSSISPTTMDLGQSSTLATTTSFSGGTFPYTCQWLMKAPGAASYSNLGVSFPCNLGDKPTVPTGALTTAGLWSFQLKVTDNGSPAQSVTSNAALTVKKSSPTLVASLTPNSIVVGGSVTGSAALTGGYQAGGSVTYEFFSGSTCTGTPTIVGSPVAVTNGSVSNSASQKFNTAGSYSWTANYTGDANNNPAAANCPTLTVFTPPTLSVPGPQSVTAGSTISFKVNATGAGGCNRVTLTSPGLPAGATFVSTQCFAGSASSVFSWTPPDSQASGDYSVTFTATDGHGSVTSSQVTIHVSPVSKAPPLPILSYSVFGIVGFLAVVLVALVLRRAQSPRRKR